MEATSDGGVRHGDPWPRALPSVVGALQPFPIDGRVLRLSLSRAWQRYPRPLQGGRRTAVLVPGPACC